METTYIFPQTYSLESEIPYGFGSTYYGKMTIQQVINALANVASNYNAIIITPQTQNHYQQIYPLTINGDTIYCCDNTWAEFSSAVSMLFAGYVGAPSTQLYYRFNSNGSVSARMESSLSSYTAPDRRTYGGQRGYGSNPCILILLNCAKQVFLNNVDITPSADIIGTGGGATHIAKVTGLLSTLSSNLSDILAVAGGGGGGLITNETPTTGANAGGISGSGSNSADQTTGYAFGQGESSGGGSGLYGGYKSANGNSGGAGSGYIGNSLLRNKKMVGYNVPVSSGVNTKTESTNIYDSYPTANRAKARNGFVKITRIRDIPEGYIFPNELTMDSVVPVTNSVNVTQMTLRELVNKIKQGASTDFNAILIQPWYNVSSYSIVGYYNIKIFNISANTIYVADKHWEGTTFAQVMASGIQSDSDVGNVGLLYKVNYYDNTWFVQSWDNSYTTDISAGGRTYIAPWGISNSNPPIPSIAIILDYTKEIYLNDASLPESI